MRQYITNLMLIPPIIICGAVFDSAWYWRVSAFTAFWLVLTLRDWLQA